MAYELIKEESIETGIHRILNEEILAAIETLENTGKNKDEAIHSVRKRIKKTRAVLRLIRHQVEDTVFKQENIRYRNIGHMLSHLRDATVMINTLNKLRQTYRKEIPYIAFRKARRALVQQQHEASREFFEEKNTILLVLDALKEASQHIHDISVEEDSFAAFAPNMKTIYKRGRKAFDLAVQDPSAHNFHELRKEVKHLGYHTRILNPLWPGFFQAYAKELDRLAELLGDDHDMGVLAEQIESGKVSFARKATTVKFLSAIAKQREFIQQQIYPLAQRILAETSGDFINRFQLYFDLWRTAYKPETAKEATITQ
jgi:CHAD domain-containing protein